MSLCNVAIMGNIYFKDSSETWPNFYVTNSNTQNLVVNLAEAEYDMGNAISMRVRQKSSLSWVDDPSNYYQSPSRLKVRGADSPGVGEYRVEIGQYDSYSKGVKSTLFWEEINIEVLDFDCASGTIETILLTSTPIKIYKDFSPSIYLPWDVMTVLGHKQGKACHGQFE